MTFLHALHALDSSFRGLGRPFDRTFQLNATCEMVTALTLS
jgi:hypothetical protein